MGSLSAVAGGRGHCLFGLSVSLPGYTLLDSLVPWTSATGGHHRGLIESWGQFRYAASDVGGRLPSVETTVRVYDHDRTLGRIKEGASAASVRGSVVACYLMEIGTASSSWDSLFVGRLVKMSYPEPFVAELAIRVNDDRILRVQSDKWKLTRQTFPNGKAEIFDLYAPILYGTHDASQTSTGPGMIPTLYCDTVRFRYLVCAGKAKSILRVYVDGTETGGGWTTQYVTINGRMYTVIEFDTDQGDATVTCDAEGYATTYGGGTLMTNPATQWAHRMSNFVLADWDGGSAYNSTSALIDSTFLSAAETYFASLGALGSDYDSEGSTGDDVTAKLMTSFQMRCGWTYSGKIAIGWDNLAAALYGGQRFQWRRDESARPLALLEEDFSVMSRIAVRQAKSAVDGTFRSSFSVVDASVSSDTPGTLDLEWSEAK